LKAICNGIASTYGATLELNYNIGYPSTINDPGMTDIVDRAARHVAGDGVGKPFLSMGGEDMSYFLQEVPGCFFFLGSAKPEHEHKQVSHHCSHFDFDERALAIGASVFIEIAREMLPNPS
jgi:amidohydrolase